MNISIQGSKNFHLSNRIKDYISRKVEKLFYFQHTINDIIFHLDSEKITYKISAVLNFKRHGSQKFEATADEMYTAIDKLIHKIDVKIQREKSKIQNHNNLGHQEVAEFFSHHENDEPEPTKFIDINSKPSTLLDAVLQMNLNKQDFFGFNMIDEEENVAPAFLRRLDSDVVYLFGYDKKSKKYAEYLLNVNSENVLKDKKIREIELQEMNLLEAQKKILDHEFHYNLFLGQDNKVNFLLKEGNGKWELLS